MRARPAATHRPVCIAGAGLIFDCTGRNLEYIFNRKVAPAAALQALTFEMLRWSCALRDYKAGELTTEQFEHKYGLSSLGWAEMEAKLARLGAAQDRRLTRFPRRAPGKSDFQPAEVAQPRAVRDFGAVLAPALQFAPGMRVQ